MLNLEGIFIDKSDFIKIAIFLITACFTFYGIRAAISLIDGNTSITKISKDPWLTDKKTSSKRSYYVPCISKRRT